MRATANKAVTKNLAGANGYVAALKARPAGACATFDATVTPQLAQQVLQLGDLNMNILNCIPQVQWYLRKVSDYLKNKLLQLHFSICFCLVSLCKFF